MCQFVGMPIDTNSIIAAVSVPSDRHDESRNSTPYNRPPTRITTPDEHLAVCVSGSVFLLSIRSLSPHPYTLLAQKHLLNKFYRPELGMYFFDRNRHIFEYILQFYQNDGYQEFPSDFPVQLVQKELSFFKIGWRKAKYVEFEEMPQVSSLREKGRAFFNEPHSSMAAKIWMCIDVFFIILSILTLLIETESEYKKVVSQYHHLKSFVLGLTILSTIFFTSDFMGRLIFAEDRLKFFCNILPWLDIIAIIPLYFDVVEGLVDVNVNNSTVSILRLFRMFRVARCLKLIRRSKRLILIFKILYECKEELSLLLLIWVIGTAVSGTIMFFLEEESNTKYYSILESCYWAIVTIGTIGYGNISPITTTGMIITTIVIFCSLIFMTVPMTIIIRRFSDSYERFDRSKSDVMLFGKNPSHSLREAIKRRRISSTCSSISNSLLINRNSSKQLVKVN